MEEHGDVVDRISKFEGKIQSGDFCVDEFVDIFYLMDLSNLPMYFYSIIIELIHLYK